MFKSSLFKTVPVIFILMACSNQSYLPPLSGTNQRDGFQKNTEEIKNQGYQESLKSIQKIPDLVKTNALTESQGVTVLKVTAQEYFENKEITDEGIKAQSLAEAIYAINSGKIVENLTELLGIEIQFNEGANQLKKLDKLFQVLNRTSSMSQALNPKKDRFLIEVLLIVQNREAQKKSFVEMLPSAKEYFERKSKLVTSEPFQFLEGYSLLSQITSNKKWLANLFVPLFNTFDVSSYDRQIFSSALKAALEGIVQSSNTFILNEQIFKNSQSLIQSRIQLLSKSTHDKGTMIQELIQTMDLVNNLFDQEDKNISNINIQTWDDLLALNSKLNDQIKSVLIENSEEFRSQKFLAQHTSTLTTLLKAASDKSLKLTQHQINFRSLYNSFSSSLFSLSKELAEKGSSKISLAAYRQYFVTFEALKAYLQINAQLADGKILKKGSIVDGKIVNSDEQTAKIYAENILSKALDLLYQNNIETPNIKNCLISDQESESKILSCKSLNTENLKFSSTSKLFLNEAPEELKHITLSGEGRLYIPAGRFTLPAKSTLNIEYPEIEFHPLAKIEIISGNINIKTDSIVNAYLDVSAIDQNQFPADINLGRPPEIVRYKSHLVDQFEFSFLRDIGKEKILKYWWVNVQERSYWDRLATIDKVLVKLDSDFQNVDALLGGSYGFNNLLDINEIRGRNDLENNFFPGEQPKINLRNIKNADAGGHIFLELQDKNYSSLLISANGGNGNNGIDGIPSVLCKNNEYKSFTFLLGNEEQYHIFKNGEDNTTQPYYNRFIEQENKLIKLVEKNSLKIQLKVVNTKSLTKQITTAHNDFSSHPAQALTHIYRISIYNIDIPGASPTQGGKSGSGGNILIKSADLNALDVSVYNSAGVAGKGGLPAPIKCFAPGEIQNKGENGETGLDGQVEEL